jgi:hypothetical protein
MTRVRAAVAGHPVALVAMALAWLLVPVVPAAYGVVAFGVALVVTGAAAALVGPRHPLRNGMLVGLIPVVVLVAVLVGQIALGTYELAAGETWGSFWLELPFWVAFVTVPAVCLALLGASIVTVVKMSNLRMRPR